MMSAAEIIAQIKELPARDQVQVARFIAESSGLNPCMGFSVGKEDDGLPVIRGQGGSISLQLVREIESLTP